ncbi:LacI family transcriptional regulator [Cellulomonas denverensis]|uniref:LacI family transcriptional regulator n=1 Tax=Cellulomonas denverensis TaxID=264297 RepID=A0A7X6KU07_9CELL|nr:LacI family transcriptional regulator [Cellulomonas denverensis]
MRRQALNVTRYDPGVSSAAPGTGDETIERRRPVTAVQVARHAGVSTATVSLVVNGKTAGRVSPQIAARVEAAIAELGYVVDRAASSLSRGSGDVVILVAPDIANPFFAGVIAGAQEALGSIYQLLLSATDVGCVPRPEDVRALFALRPAGLLVDAPNVRFLRDLDVHAPLVLIDAPSTEGVAPSVDLDVASGARQLARHLLHRGHRRIGYLDAVTGTETFVLRREALREELAAGGGVLAGPTPASVVDSAAASRAAVDAWPGWRDAGVTAVVAASDTQAYGVLHAMQGLGVPIPGELALAGFDNLPYSALTQPGLTSVELPSHQLGLAAAGHLRALIEGRAPAAPDMLPAHLVVRGSTAR